MDDRAVLRMGMWKCGNLEGGVCVLRRSKFLANHEMGKQAAGGWYGTFQRRNFPSLTDDTD